MIVIEASDSIEIIAELFGLYNFSVDYAEEDIIDYNPETKNIRMTYNVEFVDETIGLAHEIMHHKQNIEKRNLKGEDIQDYNIAAATSDFDERYLWMVRKFPTEIESHAFAALYATILYKFLYKNGRITRRAYDVYARYIKRTNKLSSYYQKDKARILEIYSQIDQEYARLEAEYGSRILQLIEHRVSLPKDERKQAIKVVYN